MAELIIIFREVLEASLIIGILFTYLKKSRNSGSMTLLWSGVGVAVLASILVSILFQNIVGGFEGSSSKIFEVHCFSGRREYAFFLEAKSPFLPNVISLSTKGDNSFALGKVV